MKGLWETGYFDLHISVSVTFDNLFDNILKYLNKSAIFVTYENHDDSWIILYDK